MRVKCRQTCVLRTLFIDMESLGHTAFRDMETPAHIFYIMETLEHMFYDTKLVHLPEPNEGVYIKGRPRHPPVRRQF